MHDEYVEDPDPDKEDCKVEDDDPKDVCKDKPTGVEEGGPEEEQPKPDSDPAFKPDDDKPDGADDGDGPDESEPGADPVFVPVVGQDCKEGWYYDDDLDRCVDMRCDPNNLEFYDASECCKSGQAGDGYVDRLCRDICDPEAEGYDVDMCCDLDGPWYDAERCEIEVEPVIEPEDPEGDGDPGDLEADPVEQPVVIDPGTVDVDELPPGAVSKCSSYINDGALEGLPDGASTEETKMFDLINAYRLSKGLSKWSWSPELHLACTVVGLFKLGAENTPEYEDDYDKARFGSLQELVMYYGYHNPVGPEYRYYKGPKPDADFIWGQTIDPTGRWGLKRALDALPGYVDCAVALVKNKSWVWMTAKGNECKEEDEEDPNEIDPNEVIDGGDELFDPAIVGTECEEGGPNYNAEWVWDETDKKCKGPDESKPEVEDPDEIDPDEVIDGGDEIFEPVTEIGTKCDPTNPEYDDTLEWDPDAKECRKKEGVEESAPDGGTDTDITDELPPGVPATYTAGASLPPGAVNPILGTECDAGKDNDKYDPTFEWNQTTKECKKRKTPEPEVKPEEVEPVTEPETPAIEPTGAPCMNIKANNFYKPGPCTFDVDPNICADASANNYNMPLPCTYNPDTCDDLNADNYGKAWPCTYTAEVPSDLPPDVNVDDVIDVQPVPNVNEPPEVVPAGDNPAVAEAEFLENRAVGSRIFFICDRSGSMAARVGTRTYWGVLKDQLFSTIRALPPDTAIQVVLFSDLPSSQKAGPVYISETWMKASSLPAIEGWLGVIQPMGSTYPKEAIKMVFKMSPAPDFVYFMTDGELSDPGNQREAGFIRYKNQDRVNRGLSKIPFNTITFGATGLDGTEQMRGIADDSGGEYNHFDF